MAGIWVRQFPRCVSLLIVFVLLSSRFDAFALAAPVQTAGPAEQETQPDSDATDPIPSDDASKLTIEIGAGAWFPRLIGDVKIAGPGASTISLDNQLDLNDLEPTLNLDFTLSVPDVAFRVSGFMFSTEGDGIFSVDAGDSPIQQFGDVTLTDGDVFESDFDLWSVGLEVQILALNFTRNIGGEDEPATLSIVPVIGARFLDVDQSVSVGAMEQDNHSQWIAAQLGGAFALRWKMPDDFPVIRRIDIEVTGQFGPTLGGDSGFVWELRAGVGLVVTDNITASFGYRLLNFDVEDEDYELDAGLQGLFVAGSLRF